MEINVPRVGGEDELKIYEILLVCQGRCLGNASLGFVNDVLKRTLSPKVTRKTTQLRSISINFTSSPNLPIFPRMNFHHQTPHLTMTQLSSSPFFSLFKSNSFFLKYDPCGLCLNPLAEARPHFSHSPRVLET